MLCSAALRKGSRCAPARKQFSHLASAVLGSLECSALGPPTQIPRGPASRAPRAGLLRLRDLATARLRWCCILLLAPIVQGMQQRTHLSDSCTCTRSICRSELSCTRTPSVLL
ncbi:hypothetical protein PF010_g16385 [Phytophthora fragariae]|uniref:Uncharacterized protein n=1 Tax=Phytophthora fragariae TaxID=53985 RepID=A0A6G0KRT3_9STRA|nr:hypothetical protein PF010_g16385 [Phytophthora fragariae]